MSRSYNQKHSGYYGNKKGLKNEYARGMRVSNKKLLNFVKKGVDPDSISFNHQKNNVSNWWNWD